MKDRLSSSRFKQVLGLGFALIAQTCFPFIASASSLTDDQDALGAQTVRYQCNDPERDEHPNLCALMDLAATDPVGLANKMETWAYSNGLLVTPLAEAEYVETKGQVAVGRKTQSLRANSPSRIQKNKEAYVEDSALSSSPIPVVLAHGMGDSCFNDGMIGITEKVSSILGGAYSTCIPTGKNKHEDTINGYLLNMDDSVEVFAENVKKDPKLADGFSAVGFSQGNSVIRGYIAKHNNPPVKTFLSINGVNAGVGAVPYCRPKSVYDEGLTQSELGWDSICDMLMEQASRKAYSEFSQKHSFQANYWRDPRPSAYPDYQKYCQLAQWNNEGFHFNQTLKDNFAKTEQFVWIMANQDRMVWPKEGEQWGAPDPNDPFNTILPMKETPWYINDLFGLKTAEEAGKNRFESFNGDHLQFSTEEFTTWIKRYLL